MSFPYRRGARRGLLTLAAGALLAGTAGAQVFVNFEDLPPSVGGGNSITNPYKGLTWSQGGTPMGWISPGAPYTDIVCRSGTNCAYNGFGVASGVTNATPFTFSGWLRRWNWARDTGGATSVVIEALVNNAVVGTVTINTSASYQYFELLTPMTALRFRPQGGSGLSCALGDANCGYFLLDDVTINPAVVPPDPGVVPEPSTYALMLTGLAGLVAVHRRRRSV